MIIKPPSNRHPFYFPDYIEVALKDFENKDWSKKSFSDLIREFRTTFISIPFFPVVLKKGSFVFRGRKKSIFHEGPFERLDEIGIKPKQFVTSFGRANIPNQSVFYCCTKPETVAREVTQWYINDSGRAQDLISRNIMEFDPFTQLMTISIWEVKEDLILASLLFNDYSINNDPLFKEFDSQRKIVDKNQNENIIKSKNLILDFFCKEYAKPDVKFEEDYKYTAYYAFEIYNTIKPKLDGLIYSSVANNYDGENIALTEDAFKQKLKFITATYCYTANVHHNPLKDSTTTIVCPVQEAQLKEDGTFIWTDVKQTLISDLNSSTTFV